MADVLGEAIGTCILVLLGNGVVANVVLDGTKGQGSGWIVIAWGWGMAVFAAVLTVGPFSGAHLNPAVSLALAATGKADWAALPGLVAAQFAGAAAGAVLVAAVYRDHLAATDDAAVRRAVFCTAPEIRRPLSNLLAEAVGTFVLVFAVMLRAAPDVGLGALDALPVGLLVLAIGLGLGGPTGYAINPARDLAPRMVHALLPFVHRGADSDWRYAWVPVIGPLAGCVAAAAAYRALQTVPGIGP